MCKKLVWLAVAVLMVNVVMGLPARAQDPSLLGWWKLDDGSGTTAVDSSGRGNDGTINNPEGWVSATPSGVMTTSAAWSPVSAATTRTAPISARS
jgi:hypothetical protein